MKKKANLVFTFLIIFSFHILGFSQYTLTGTVKNESGELLKFASVFMDDSTIGGATDEHGVFKLEGLSAGEYTLRATYLSYKSFEQKITVPYGEEMNIVLEGDALNLDALEIIANRVSHDHPIAHQNISREAIENNDFGKDIPVLLQRTPSLVMTSDAGNGVGYTSMRIRGFDQSRINVNINGVPLNDPESQAVFFVDIPDLLSSTEDIQIQRGVGSSTNGPGAFGASVSLNTNRRHINPYAELNVGYGSYNTQNYTGVVGTGLMNGKYALDFRYSLVSSDGYIDRAASNLNSYYISAVKIGAKSSLRFISFSGHETTYQAWYGTPKEKLFGTKEELKAHYNRNVGSIYKNSQDSINLFSSDRKYNYYTYKNQVDDYKQTHYQLHYNRIWTDKLSTKAALYSSLGNGYYEEFKFQDKYANYLLSDAIVGGDTLTRGNITRRRNLENTLYGMFINTSYDLNSSIKFDIGIAGSLYDGDHFGKVIRASNMPNLDVDNNYYFSNGDKNEASTYLKMDWNPLERLGVYFDMQYRYVGYKTKGTDNDQQHFDVNQKYNFLNPKLGVSYQTSKLSSLNLFLGVSNREPSRNDFVDVVKDATPKHESIIDYELSFRYANSRLSFETNAYYMDYKNQLVLRGDLNDVGASIRVNVDDSYRLGLENSFDLKLTDKLSYNANLTLSKNKIESYNEYIFSYDENESIRTTYENSNIAFSPSVISNMGLSYSIFDNWVIAWDAHWVSKQYLDNTSSEDKIIPAYRFLNFTTSYTVKTKRIKAMKIALRWNNVSNRHYVSNGYTYAYIWGDKITESFYYPQAESNFSISVNMKLQ